MTELLRRCPVIPVVVLDDPAQALPLGAALEERWDEVTERSTAAFRAAGAERG
ncbi:hypothetical protein AB0I53_21865 [Saccharopolyspora sp. NPDC050389]|uniref:hypothetical protein n=1 Tax=Saccharopolyspora sp. NPDC050389 TaxID=3155516 RepID=UPI0033EF5330